MKLIKTLNAGKSFYRFWRNSSISHVRDLAPVSETSQARDESKHLGFSDVWPTASCQANCRSSELLSFVQIEKWVSQLMLSPKNLIQQETHPVFRFNQADRPNGRTRLKISIYKCSSDCMYIRQREYLAVLSRTRTRIVRTNVRDHWNCAFDGETVTVLFVGAFRNQFRAQCMTIKSCSEFFLIWLIWLASCPWCFNNTPIMSANGWRTR